MPSAEYCRIEADRCGRLADESKDPEAASRWRAMARAFAALADELEERSPPALSASPGPMQREIQQPHKKMAEDGN